MTWWMEERLGPQTMTAETAETFDHPCGFVRLRERHRVKAISVPHNPKEAPVAPRKPKPAEPAVVAEPTVEQPVIHYIPNPVTVAAMTPRTRDEIAIRDAVRARLAVVETAIVEFVAEKTSEGFSLEEIDALYSSSCRSSSAIA